MFKLESMGKTCLVEFKHETTLGKRHKLPRNFPVTAITTCVVVCAGFTSIATAVCLRGDNFSRAVGRDIALEKALEGCVLLRGWRYNIRQEYCKHVNAAPHLGVLPSAKISDDERRKRIDDGASLRVARADRRGSTPK